MNTTTTIDVNFLGLFPKSLIAVQQNYKQSLEKDMQSDFDELINYLISASICQPKQCPHQSNRVKLIYPLQE